MRENPEGDGSPRNKSVRPLRDLQPFAAWHAHAAIVGSLTRLLNFAHQRGWPALIASGVEDMEVFLVNLKLRLLKTRDACAHRREARADAEDRHGDEQCPADAVQPGRFQHDGHAVADDAHDDDHTGDHGD